MGVDLNTAKFPLAEQMGAHACVNPGDCKDGDVKGELLAVEK